MSDEAKTESTTNPATTQNPAQAPSAPEAKVSTPSPQGTPKGEGEKTASETPKATATKEEPKGDAKVDDTSKKQESTSQAQKVAPEKYDLKTAKDELLLADNFYAALEKIARDNGMSQEEAQQFVSEKEAEVRKLYDEQSAQWLKETQADPRFQGKLEEHVELAKRALEFVGDPELTKALNVTGYGNHRAVIHAFAKFGRLLQDDKLVVPGSSDAAPRLKSAAEVFYGQTGQGD
jgi:hypothetical protein